MRKRQIRQEFRLVDKGECLKRRPINVCDQFIDRPCESFRSGINRVDVSLVVFQEICKLH